MKSSKPLLLGSTTGRESERLAGAPRLSSRPPPKPSLLSPRGAELLSLRGAEFLSSLPPSLRSPLGAGLLLSEDEEAAAILRSLFTEWPYCLPEEGRRAGFSLLSSSSELLVTGAAATPWNG